MKWTGLLILAWVSVTAPVAGAPREEARPPEAFARVELGREGPVWVGERVPLYVDLFVQGRFSGTPRFNVPEIPGMIVIQVEERPVVGTESRHGVSYVYQRHEFALFPERAGTFAVPPFEVRFASVEALGGARTEHLLTTRGVAVTARMPPGAGGMRILVSTRDLRVRQSWEPPVEEATPRVGDAFRRRIVMRGSDVPAMLLPPLPFPAVEGLGVYPREAEVRDRMDRGVFVGERIETVTYVCERPGTVEIPAMTVRWFDLSEERLREERIPGVTLEVSENPALAAGAGGILRGLLPPWVVLLGGGLVGLVLLVAAGIRRSWWAGAVEPVRAWRMRRADAERAAFRRFRRACRAGRPEEAYRHLVAWLDRVSPAPGALTVERFVGAVGDPVLEEEVRRLHEALFSAEDRGGHEGGWSGRGLYRAVAVARRRVRRRRRRPTGRRGLPPLNPGPRSAEGRDVVSCGVAGGGRVASRAGRLVPRGRDVSSTRRSP